MEVPEKMKEAFKVKAAKVTSAVLVAAMTFALIPKFIGNDVRSGDSLLCPLRRSILCSAFREKEEKECTVRVITTVK